MKAIVEGKNTEIIDETDQNNKMISIWKQSAASALVKIRMLIILFQAGS